MVERVRVSGDGMEDGGIHTAFGLKPMFPLKIDIGSCFQLNHSYHLKAAVVLERLDVFLIHALALFWLRGVAAMNEGKSIKGKLTRIT